MRVPYTKTHLSLTDQLALLKSRGIQVADDALALECLHRNGYYRLSAYWYPFRIIVPRLDIAGSPLLDKHGKQLQERSDDFLTDSKFEDARALYLFDKEFKLLLLDAIERIEIAARAEIALVLGAVDAFAHTNSGSASSIFRTSFLTSTHGSPSKHQEWIDKFDVAVTRSREEFVQHHTRKYSSPLPIWKAIELWDFGMLSRFYSGLDTPHRVNVASRFNVPDWYLMESWLRSINYVRNTIAHHGRLWNRAVVLQPSPPSIEAMPNFDPLLSDSTANTRIYFLCCILCHFTKVSNPQSKWPQKLSQLMQRFPIMPYASVKDMGFPDDWKTHSFWQ